MTTFAAYENNALAVRKKPRAKMVNLIMSDSARLTRTRGLQHKLRW